jgi:hypothetical protein
MAKRQHGKVAGAAALWLACAAGPAHADFTICNDTFDVINVAVGHEGAEGFATEGWWTIGTNRCAVPLRGTLGARYLYVYATDVLGPILRVVHAGDTAALVCGRLRGILRPLEDGGHHLAAPGVLERRLQDVLFFPGLEGQGADGGRSRFAMWRGIRADNFL